MNRRRSRPTSGQLAAFAALDRLAHEHPELGVLGSPEPGNDGEFTCRIRIDTQSFVAAPGGLPVQPVEEIRITVGPGYPLMPPRAAVDHVRWLGYPHVLQGTRLCLYMDPNREWDPCGGMAAAVQRLWDWLDDAVAGRFDADEALYHGLGGVIAADGNAPYLTVARAPRLRPGIRRIVVEQRRDRRYDLVAWDRGPQGGERRGLCVTAAVPYRAGPGTTLRDLSRATDCPVYAGWNLRAQGFPTGAMLLNRLRRLRILLADGEVAYLLLAAPNPARSGNAAYDLACAQIDAADIDAAIADNQSPTPRLTFLSVDDVRPEITRRRDEGRPMTWFADKTCEVWGCGALGSWVAELLVRAGAMRLVLRDPGRVSSGLLVRQDYTDDDVGENKADALARRLQTIAPPSQIEVRPDVLMTLASDLVSGCDLIVDASVNASVAAVLAQLQPTGEAPMVAQVTTDSATATLGLLTMTPIGGRSIIELDAAARNRVFSEGSLEDFRVFWESTSDESIVPAMGCSTPTFRGTAADAMGISGTAMSLLGGAAEARPEGSYLFVLPHSPSTAPPCTWVGGAPSGS